MFFLFLYIGRIMRIFTYLFNGLLVGKFLVVWNFSKSVREEFRKKFLIIIMVIDNLLAGKTGMLYEAAVFVMASLRITLLPDSPYRRRILTLLSCPVATLLIKCACTKPWSIW